MTGGQEVPPSGSPATGTCVADLDASTGAVSFSGAFSGLDAAASSAGLYGLAASGVTARVLVPETTLTAATAGVFSGNGTLTPPDVAGMIAGETYCQVDDSAFPSGEIRGQLTVPPPAPALPLSGVAMLGVVLTGLGYVALSLRLRTRT